MPRSIAAAYPLMKKAMRAQSAAQRLLGCDMCKDAKGVQYRALQLIDRHIDAPPAEKEELMVALIFSQSHPFAFDDLDRIRDEYGERLSARAVDILQGRHHHDDAFRFIKAATTVAMTEMAARHAGDIVRPCGKARIAALREGVAKDVAFFEALGCQGLRRAFIKAKSSLLARVETACAGATAAPAKRTRHARTP